MDIFSSDISMYVHDEIFSEASSNNGSSNAPDLDFSLGIKNPEMVEKELFSRIIVAHRHTLSLIVIQIQMIL